MKVNRIVLKNFMIEGEETLELPETGVVTLVGPNGAGKSRWIEAVAVALGGDTLRGSTPWIDGKVGGLLMVADGHKVSMGVTAARRVKIELDGAAADTPTKTRELIQSSLGSLDFWRRTHVFASVDAVNFSSATDGQRKTLIELMLGHNVFDEASENLAQMLREKKQQLMSARQEQTTLEANSQAAQWSLDNWQEDPVFQPEPAPVRPLVTDVSSDVIVDENAKLEHYHYLLASLSLQPLASVFPGTQEQVYSARANVASAERAMKAIESGLCVTCGSVFSSDDLSRAKKMVADAVTSRLAAESTLLLEQTEVDVKRLSRDQTRKELELGIRDIEQARFRRQFEQTQLTAWSEATKAWEARETERRSVYDKQIEIRQRNKKKIVDTLAEWKDQIAEVKQLVQELTLDVAELETAGKALPGIRAAVLGRSLTGIEEISNHYLRRVAPGVSIVLRPYSETNKGSLNDKISLEIKGFGGGHGYKASSSGQRRRVDAAMLVAISEVASAAAGFTNGTLWFDEVFDALDEQGRALVAEVLGEIASTRAVVVITHMEDLADLLPAVKRYRVDHGRLIAV